MARASVGIRIAVVCTVLTASWSVAGPAQAGVGDIVDDVTGDAGGQVVPDPVKRTVDDTVDQVTHTVDDVTRQATDAVHQATAPARPSDSPKPSPAGGSSGTPDPAPQPSPPPSDPVDHAAPAVRSTPRPAPAAPRVDTSAAPTGPRHHRHARLRGHSSEHASHAAKRHPQAQGAPVLRPPLAASRSPQMTAAAPAPQVAPACESDSLAADELRRCARTTTALPGLGGVPLALPPTGLLLVALGLVLVVVGRRRHPSVAPAT